MNDILQHVSSIPDDQKYHGGHGESKRINLMAGNLQAVYQKGSIRHISDSKNEIIRMIYSAVRDREWMTVEPSITDEEFDIKPDSFKISFDCSYRAGDMDFVARYTLEGSSDGSIIFEMDGEALSFFEKNRIGFCVLHPVEECAGRECEILNTTDEFVLQEFPYFISPDQPFRDIRTMKWNCGRKICRIDFHGDIFETEDQRNWTDASYKTYCTPLDLPSPVMIKKGTKIRQRVTLSVEGALPVKSDIIHAEVTIDRKIVSGLPFIGFGRSSRNISLSENETDALRNLKFDHYRTDLYLFSSNWRQIAEIAADEAFMLNVPLELALFFDHDAVAQADSLINWISSGEKDIRVIIIYHAEELTTPVYLQEVLPPVIRKVLPRVLIGFGTNANFAELNRDRPTAGGNDLICYSVHPQEHASDNETLVENLHGQGYTAESAGYFANGKGIWISPVNIQRRFNANVEAFERPHLTEGFPSQADSRLMSLFGAAWTAGSIKYLAGENVKGITYYETVGERGILQGDCDSRWPDEFASVRGMIFPVYHVFRYLLADKSFKVIKSRSSKPLVTDCNFLLKGKRVKGIIMNFTSGKPKVKINGISNFQIVKILNIHSFSDAVSDIHWLNKDRLEIDMSGRMVEMDPYSLFFIEGEC